MIAREIGGLGFSFALDKKSNTLQITKVFASSPAAQAGLKTGLVIERIADTPTAGKTVDECLTLLHPTNSARVQLRLIDPQRNQTNTVELTRGKFLTAG